MPRRPSPSPSRPALAVAACAALAAAGCAGYRSGAASLYAPDVATVYVPMVQSDSFRRDLGERLTEALVKEIELKTPYKVVASPNADSILEVRLRSERRLVQAEDPFDNPRIFAEEVFAEASWLNRRRVPMGPPRAVPLPGELAVGPLPGFSDRIAVHQSTPLTPESGQTIASQQQLAIARLAEQIVGVMEEPW